MERRAVVNKYLMNAHFMDCTLSSVPTRKDTINAKKRSNLVFYNKKITVHCAEGVATREYTTHQQTRSRP